MKVIVKESGFYAGTWYEAGPRAVEMNDRVARAFLPPHGDQLGVAESTASPSDSAQKPSKKKAR